jgi:hypothetical protein
VTAPPIIPKVSLTATLSAAARAGRGRSTSRGRHWYLIEEPHVTAIEPDVMTFVSICGFRIPWSMKASPLERGPG